MRRGRVIARGALTVVIGSLTLTACGSSPPGPSVIAGRFVAAWNRGDWVAMSKLVDGPPADFATTGLAISAGLGSSGTATHVLGAVTPSGGTVSAAVNSSYPLAGVGPWRVASTLALAKRSGHWLVEWSPSAIAPGLAAGDRLALTRLWAPGAPILGAGGAPLTLKGDIVVVGIEGSRVKDPSALSAVLTGAGATTAEVNAALSAAAAYPTFFEPVFDLTKTRFDQLGGRSSTLYQFAGTVFQAGTAREAATPGLAAHLVGRVGPVTAEELAHLGPAYNSDSVVGQNGLEAQYETRLAGTPGGDIEILTSLGKPRATLATFAPKPGTPVQTSIDPTVQKAAEAALVGVPGNAALVAVRVSTGQVLASVSDPAEYQFDQALEGEFPPGSTFKVITSTALIDKGLSPSSPASCPPSLTVDGEAFHNAEGDSPASDLEQAFVESCNTAFIGLATQDLQLGSLPAAASLYGIGGQPKVGLPAFGGSVPLPSDRAGLAQTAIGQAKVVVSPLQMAMVAAAVGSGTVRAPRLVAGAGDDAVPGRPLPQAVVTDLQEMMAQVVTSGTAAGTGLPAGTHAKTGTAEYGSGSPQPTDAWLIGYDGDVAFAAVVRGTGNGGPTDGPIVARFLDALGPSA